MRLQCCALAVTMSWDDGLLGARASRPHQAWHSLGHLPHLDQPGTAPWVSFGLADGVPADRVAACTALAQRRPKELRAGRPPPRGHLDQPGTAPWLSFGLADGVPADRVAACSIALKLSGGQRDRMRAGRPRSQGNHSPLGGESQKPRARRRLSCGCPGVGRRLPQQMPTCTHWDATPVCPGERSGPPPCRAGSFEEKRPIVNADPEPPNGHQ